MRKTKKHLPGRWVDSTEAKAGGSIKEGVAFHQWWDKPVSPASMPGTGRTRHIFCDILAKDAYPDSKS